MGDMTRHSTTGASECHSTYKDHEIEKNETRSIHFSDVNRHPGSRQARSVEVTGQRKCCTYHRQAGKTSEYIRERHPNMTSASLRGCTHHRQAGHPSHSKSLKGKDLESTHQISRFRTTSNGGKCRCCLINIDSARLLVRPPSTNTSL